MKLSKNWKKVIDRWKYFVLIVSFLLIFFIDNWVEHSDISKSFYDNVLFYLFDYIQLPVVYSLLIVMLLVAFYTDIIRQKEDDINSQAASMIKINSELATLKARSNFLSAMSSFTNSQPSVYAVQLYKFSIRHHLNNISKIKVEHLDGYVKEEINLNALLQLYFVVDKKYLKIFSMH
ncbi:hypothetical protein [Brevibacillus brevis]|nr:hypothetical protein [Brevibacillus brevis]RED30119.1 hypothetical protein DES34_105338 [Brevibacillus brevis]VEF88666.1 Uncharacterised protein [Brevibacillus brevis]